MQLLRYVDVQNTIPYATEQPDGSALQFVKSVNTSQSPGDPIVLPRQLRSDEVDYGCELAVVIMKACKNVS